MPVGHAPAAEHGPKRAAVALSAGVPLAADMPVKAPAAPAYSWEGFYVGGNVGWLGIEGVSLSENEPGLRRTSSWFC
jgi:hypothetical protein